MGVLLAFKTSQSYDRFWAGRLCWMDAANSIRNLGRMAATSCRKSRYEAMQRHLMAFPVALRQHLRGERDLGEFEPFLETGEATLPRLSPLGPSAVRKTRLERPSDDERRGGASV